MKLGEILIQEGHLTQEGLQESLDWQVLYGGRLGTNLLELRLVTEEQLARALGHQLGVEVAWGELEVDPDMLGLVPRHIADRNELVPWKIEKRRLKVLSTEASRLALVDELSMRSGKACQLVVAPEFRLFQLLRKHYQATRQMRALDFGVVPVERDAMRRKKEKEKDGHKVEDAPELIDESAFQQIYAEVMEGRTPGGSGASKVDAVDISSAVESLVASEEPSAPTPFPRRDAKGPNVTPPAVKPAPAKKPLRFSPTPAQTPQQKAAPGARPAPPAGAIVRPRAPPPPQTSTLTDARPVAKAKRPAAPVIEQLPDDAILGEALVEAAPLHDTSESEPLPPEVAADFRMHPPEASRKSDAPAAPSAPSAWDAPPPEPALAPEEPPLAFKEALALLAGVTDRDAIARIVLRAGRSQAKRVLLMTVQGNVALGWDGLGEGLQNGAARAVAVPLSMPGAFQLVVRSRSHFLGPLQKTPSNIRFLAQLGKKVPLSSLLLPILHGERVSHLLYLDNGHKQHAPSDIGELLILSQRVAQSVQALLERKRQAARG